MFFFFKQKTAYEMRISDWSSDVCSSDLQHRDGARPSGTRSRSSDSGLAAEALAQHSLQQLSGLVARKLVDDADPARTFETGKPFPAIRKQRRLQPFRRRVAADDGVDALSIFRIGHADHCALADRRMGIKDERSEEHTSEL